jgi:hypothetical protein
MLIRAFHYRHVIIHRKSHGMVLYLQLPTLCQLYMHCILRPIYILEEIKISRRMEFSVQLHSETPLPLEKLARTTIKAGRVVRSPCIHIKDAASLTVSKHTKTDS